MIVTKMWDNIVQFIQQQRISLIIRYPLKNLRNSFHEKSFHFRIFFGPKLFDQNVLISLVPLLNFPAKLASNF